MGPNSQPLYVCYVMDGEEPIARFEANNIGELTITFKDECEKSMPLIAGAIGMLSFKLKVKPPKEWRCTSRKRFTKLMMSYGCSRNDANALAPIIQAPVGPQSYQELFYATMALYAECATRKDEEHGTA